MVDNNSTDDSKSFFEAKFYQASFIWSDDNLGFAKANNLALKKASGKYIVFINPDVIIGENTISECINFFEHNLSAGAVGVKMLDGSGTFLKESKRAFPSPSTSLFKLAGLSKLFPHSKTVSKYHLGHLDENKDQVVDVLAGAFMMVRKDILDKTGSFDEAFFMYGEDIDLSFRIQQAGFKNYYLSKPTIIHFKGESTKKGSLNYVKLFYRAMSIFVTKHYAGSKAQVYKLLIHVAITLRAFISAMGRLIKWIGMPLIDAGLILLSFWVIKLIWNYYIKSDVNYSPNMLLIAFPIFTVIYLLAAYFTGLYDNGFSQSRLNKSATFAILILLAGYSLLPESLRFSRGILLFGSILAFFLITIIRQLFINTNLIKRNAESHEHNQTLIIGSAAEYEKAASLMKAAGMQERVIGRISLLPGDNHHSVGTINNINSLIKNYNIKEVIFCEGTMNFENIIDVIPSIPKQIKKKFYTNGARSIIGSDNRNFSGDSIGFAGFTKHETAVFRRNKRLADILIAIAFIITLPIQIVIQVRPVQFLKNILLVIVGKRTWIGYLSATILLPKLPKGIITVTGLPSTLNKFPLENSTAADEWYISDFDIWNDIKLVCKNYKHLSVKA